MRSPPSAPSALTIIAPAQTLASVSVTFPAPEEAISLVYPTRTDQPEEAMNHSLRHPNPSVNSVTAECTIENIIAWGDDIDDGWDCEIV